MSRAKIAIVGSAIAGSMAAILLHRAGFDVTIFEQRQRGVLVDRGAGIALPKYLVKDLIDQDILDKDFPILNINDREFLFYNPETKQERCLGLQPFIAYGVHWGSLYTNLARRIPEDIIHYDTKVTQVKPGEKVQLTFSDNQQQEFDFVIFADGYHSVGRNYLYPDFAPKFANYIAWRGTLVRIDEETDKRLTNKVPFYVFEKGHLLLYTIPQLNAKNPEKEYIVNWLIYETIDQQHPLSLVNKAHENIMPNQMMTEYRNYLNDLASKYFCPFAQEIIGATEAPFTQAIHDAFVPNYFANRIALVGDASILARPHVGAGSTKAIEDALSLCTHLQSTSGDLYNAFETWGKERQYEGNKLLTLCRELGKLLVSDMPDWYNVSQYDMNRFWETTVKGYEDWYQINNTKNFRY